MTSLDAAARATPRMSAVTSATHASSARDGIRAAHAPRRATSRRAARRDGAPTHPSLSIDDDADADASDDGCVAAMTPRRRAALAAMLAVSSACVAPRAARAADRRTMVQREILPSDFESLETFERARGGRASVSSSSSVAAAERAKGIPINLRSSEEDMDENEMNVLYTTPPEAEPVEAKSGVDIRRWSSAAFQWGFIGAVGYSAWSAQRRSDVVTKRLGLGGVAASALIGTSWRVTADIGRENGTWMPPNWGASGMRLIVPLAITFKANGVAEVIATGAFAPMTFGEGSWSIDGDTLRFNFPMTAPTKRGDIEFGEEKLYFKTQAWANQMSTKGRLLVNQTRFGFRREWRSVGVFKSEPLVISPEDENAPVVVPPMRVRVPQ